MGEQGGPGPDKANDLLADDIYCYNYQRIRLKRSGAANAAPLRFKSLLFLLGRFMCSPCNLGPFNIGSATAAAGSLMPQKSARKTGRLCIKAIQLF